MKGPVVYGTDNGPGSYTTPIHRRMQKSWTTKQSLQIVTYQGHHHTLIWAGILELLDLVIGHVLGRGSNRTWNEIEG